MKLLRFPLLLTCAAIFILVSNSYSQTSTAITAKDLHLRMNILASDSLAGRRTGEPGCDKAARYIASEFKRFGLIPLDEQKTYLQHYDFSEKTFDSTKIEKTKAANV